MTRRGMALPEAFVMPPFSPRQTQVAELLMEQKSCAEIGRMLGITRCRVYQHRIVIARKMKTALGNARLLSLIT